MDSFFFLVNYLLILLTSKKSLNQGKENINTRMQIPHLYIKSANVFYDHFYVI